MSTYEIVSIVRPDFDEDALNAAIERIHQRITENGGTVKSTDRWGKRRIAYPIQNYRDGFYVLTVFDLDSGRVGPLRQTLGLHEGLLRFTVATHRASQAPAAATPTQAPAATAPAQAPAATAPAAPTTTPPAGPTAPTAAEPAATASPTTEEHPSDSPSGTGHV
ncbi:MAG TPA: 30S ribosomal protein S6 [bacterium]|nr:30S ribosomal protein S6 [bacterium]